MPARAVVRRQPPGPFGWIMATTQPEPPFPASPAQRTRTSPVARRDLEWLARPRHREPGGPVPSFAASCATPPASPGEVFLPELRNPARRRGPRRLQTAQFHPADLAGDRLGQIAELHAPDPLVRRHPLPAEGHDRLRQLRRSLATGGQQYVGLWHRESNGVR